MDAPKVSVIVPVYNSERYLARCVGSIRAQTLQDIEILLIDDGSLDRSGGICDELARMDERIRVVHKQNGGVSDTRNVGVANARADWIMFVDNDDTVEPDFCERPYTIAQQEGCDLVYVMHDCTDSKGKTWPITTPFADGIISEADALYINNHLSVTVWSFLYSKRLFEHISFPCGRLVEDLAVTHRFIHAAERIYLINDCLYHYVYGRPGSGWNSPSDKLITDVYDMGMQRICDLESWGYDTTYERHLCTLYYLAHKGRDGDKGPACDAYVRSSKVVPDGLDKTQRAMLRLYRLSRPLFDLVCNATGQRKNAG